MTKELGPRANLNLVLAGVEAMAEVLDPEINLYQLMTFLVVATHEGDPLAIKDIGELTGMASSTTSRNVAVMCEYKTGLKKGYNLLVSREDVMERRRKLVTLSPHGMKIAEDIGRRIGRKVDAVLKRR